MAGLDDPHQGLTGLDFRRNVDSFYCAGCTQTVQLLSSFARYGGQAHLPVGIPLEVLMGDPFTTGSPFEITKASSVLFLGLWQRSVCRHGGCVGDRNHRIARLDQAVLVYGRIQHSWLGVNDITTWCREVEVRLQIQFKFPLHAGTKPVIIRPGMHCEHRRFLGIFWFREVYSLKLASLWPDNDDARRR